MKISAVWIVKNEEKNLKRSMDSVRQLVDEMVVVDTGSEDGTQQVAKDNGARLEHFEWIQDFAAARNYALECVADADMVIVLDADEWFEPALDASLRPMWEEEIASEAWEVATVTLTSVDSESELSVGDFGAPRIFRGNAGVRYRGSVHETPYIPGKETLNGKAVEGLHIMHSGYSMDVSAEKLERNLTLLEDAFDKESDAMRKALYAFYLMRESMTRQHKERAADMMQYLLAHEGDTKKMLLHAPAIAGTYVLLCISLASQKQSLFSYKQIGQMVVKPFMELFPRHSMTPLLRLYHESMVRPNENNLLEGLGAAIEAAQQNAAETEVLYGSGEYEKVVGVLSARAARALLRRGRREDVLDCVVRSARVGEAAINSALLTGLMSSLHGLPEADVINFVNKILPTEKRGVVQFLIETVPFEGGQTFFLYYMEKAIKANWVDPMHLWYLLIMQGKGVDAIQLASQSSEQAGEPLVQRIMFLACVCGQSIELYTQIVDRLSSVYADVLRAIFSGEKPDELEDEVLLQNYGYVAFAVGEAAANMLAAVYGRDSSVVFIAKAEYALKSGLWDKLLAENTFTPAPDDVRARNDLAELYLMARQYPDALRTLQVLLEAGGGNYETFNLLQAIAGSAEGETIPAAQHLYDAYYPAYLEWADLLDVAETGYVAESDNKKARRALATMTEKQLDAIVERERGKAGGGQQQTLMTAAQVYTDKKVYHRAVACYARLLSMDCEPALVYTRLADVFSAVNNPALAGALRQKAGS